MKKKNYLKLHLAMLLFFFVAASGLMAQNASSIVADPTLGDADLQTALNVLDNHPQPYLAQSDAIVKLKTEATQEYNFANSTTQKTEAVKAQVRGNYYEHLLNQLLLGVPLSDRFLTTTYPFLTEKFQGMDPIQGFTAESVFNQTVDLLKQ